MFQVTLCKSLISVLNNFLLVVDFNSHEYTWIFILPFVLRKIEKPKGYGDRLFDQFTFALIVLSFKRVCSIGHSLAIVKTDKTSVDVWEMALVQ